MAETPEEMHRRHVREREEQAEDAAQTAQDHQDYLSYRFKRLDQERLLDEIDRKRKEHEAAREARLREERAQEINDRCEHLKRELWNLSELDPYLSRAWQSVLSDVGAGRSLSVKRRGSRSDWVRSMGDMVAWYIEALPHPFMTYLRRSDPSHHGPVTEEDGKASRLRTVLSKFPEELNELGGLCKLQDAQT